MSSRRAKHRTRKASRNASKHNPDSDVLFKIKQCLVKRHRIPSGRILIEPAIKFTRDGPKVMRRRPNYFRMAFMKDNVRTPDIVVVDEENKPILIIEQDGHTHNTPEAVKRDVARNAQYDRAGIPYIILNTQKIKATGMTTAQYLDEKMKEINILLGKNSRRLSGSDLDKMT